MMASTLSKSASMAARPLVDNSSRKSLRLRAPTVKARKRPIRRTDQGPPNSPPVSPFRSQVRSSFLQTEIVLVGIFAIAALAFVLEGLIRLAERIFVPWRGKA